MKSASPDDKLRRSSRRQGNVNGDLAEYSSSVDFSDSSEGSKSKKAKLQKDKTNNERNTRSSDKNRQDPLRKSSRANKFSRSMNEKEVDVDYFFTINENHQHKKGKKSSSDDESVDQTEVQSASDSELEYDLSSDSTPPGTKKRLRSSNKKTPARKLTNSNQKVKSPAISHSSRRRKMKSDISIQSSEEDTESDEDAELSDSDEEFEVDDDEEPLKIQRIIASRSETRKVWKSIMKDMNTSEVEDGSRWFQKEIDSSQDHVYEERFLVKWADVSFLHCSWEMEDDLIEQVEGAKNYLNTFFRKSVNGLLFDLDERGDGEYFNPDYVQIERIIGIEYPEYDCVYTKLGNKGDSTKATKSKKKDDKTNNGILGNENIAKYGILLDKGHSDYEERTGRQFLVKWTSCGYSECTYEFERDLILIDVDYVPHVEDFVKRRKKPTKTKMNECFAIEEKQKRRLYKFFGEKAQLNSEEKEIKVKDYQDKLSNYEFPNGGKLRDYQAEGVSWILSNYINGRSSILADEMGLGKTLQTAIYINMLATTLNCRGPYLIIAPLSTVQHWQREFQTWTNLNTIIYHGLAADRGYIREYEFAFESDRPEEIGLRQSYLSKVHNRKAPKWSRTWMVEVVITTPEIITSDDYPELCAVPWEVMVVDEAHKLKSFTSKFNTCLRSERFRFKQTLLLTGTPIQNNIKELWTLMNFVDPEKFQDSSDFLENYENMKSKDKVDELHESIRPYILRRLKEDVEKSVPPKEETIIEVELTPIQKTYYRALYEKNIKFLYKNKKKGLDGPSINNLAMQLRKCCNHPFLLRGVEQELKNQYEQEGKVISEADFLCTTSGKLVLLNKLLPRLKSDGHRVLMFSQFKIMLDVLEDYLRLSGTKYERIDGSITGQKRQMAIDRFQAKEEDSKELPHVMLLSTRAGGVGINLTAADTCIIYDSDWNPQNDLQAQARCHRIGQTKKVKVYRLLSRKSYEMQMFHMSSLKMGLDQAVLQGIENNGSSSGDNDLTKEEVERLLRHGAYDVFNEEKDGSSEKESNEFLESDIDTILARRSRKIVHENTGSASSAAGGTFSKAVFKNDSGNSESKDIDIDDPEFWKKMVGEDALKVNDDTGIIHKKRKRNVTNYSEHIDAEVMNAVESEYESNDESDSDESDNGFMERFRWGGKQESEWNNDDVIYLVKQIAIHGYTRKEIVIENIKKFASSSTRYSEPEILRMIWTIVLISVLETVDSEIIDKKKAAKAKAAKKKIEFQPDKRKKSLINDSEVKGEKSQSLKDKEHSQSSDLKEQQNEKGTDLMIDKDQCFRKIIATHMSWISSLFDDAHKGQIVSRDQYIIDAVIRKKKTNSALVKAFHENIWPALKSRGWKTEEEESDSEFDIPNKTTYRFKGGRQYSSVSVVMSVAKIQHPELKHVIDTVQCKSQDTGPNDRNDTTNQKLSITNGTYHIVRNHLEKFGSLQLLFDRTCKRPLISYPRKFLASFLFVQKVNTFLNIATKLSQENTDSSDSNQILNLRLKELLRVSRKAPLPHPQWTGYHDAVLFRAISKHGWIDRSDHYKAMTLDTDIEWGRPFDTKNVPQEIDSKNEKKEDFMSTETVAKRVATFLNEFGQLVDDLGFNKKLLVSTYCLRKEQDDNESSPGKVRWIVDLSQNKLGNTESSGVKDDKSNEISIFPSRSDLAKRAKYILTNASTKIGSKSENSHNPKEQMKYGYAVLNQGKRSNFFLAELLRLLTKNNYKQAGVPFSKKIMSIAVKEADELYKCSLEKEDEKGESDVMNNILLNLRVLESHNNLISRPIKNIFRVILGMEPVKSSTKSSDSLFPVFETPSSQQNEEKSKEAANNNTATTTSTTATSAAKSKAENPKKSRPLKLRDSASGDIAISKALEHYLSETRRQQDMKGIESKLKITSFETLMLSVVCSQGLPVWSERWGEVIAGNMTHSNGVIKEPQNGKEFRITWVGMGLVMERAANEWKRIANLELMKIRERLKQVKSPDQLKTLNDKLDVLKHDSKTKEEAYCEALLMSKDPLLLAKKVIMLLEALRLRMGSIEFYKGLNQKKSKQSITSDNGIGPRVLNWMAKELLNWAKSLGIIDVRTRTPCSFTSISNQEAFHDVRVVAALDQTACRKIFAQVSQQCRLRSVIIINGLPGLTFLVPQVVKALKRNGDEWLYEPMWWDAVQSSESTIQCINDINLIGGILNYGYSGFDAMLQHYALFRKYVHMEVPQYRSFSRSVVQPRINQLTRELSLLEDNATVARLVMEQKSSGLKRKSSSPSSYTVQTGLAAFFKPPKKAALQRPNNLSTLKVENISPSQIASTNATKSFSKNQLIGSNVIDLCEVSSDEENAS